ncbi:Hypothetical predicted protein [Paramuricea clavata]|uniref:Uncharacterized protein n=1 Tax=Paramuricea clavata TaxID=317549 RepID=A0A6S7K075_PARCT|nr:Hypothetical predicted protein [Paramuricea clavata]
MRMVRSNSSSKLLEVREEALHWAEEDEKLRRTKRNVSSEAVSITQPNKEMDKVLQALEEQRTELLSTSGWLKLTAANGLEILYLGYFELDIEIFDLKVCRREILVAKNSAINAIRPRKREVPGLLGMNVLCEMGQVLGKFEGTEFLSKIDHVWSQPIQAAKRRANTSVRGIVRVAGKLAVWTPANAVTTIPATGWGGQVKCEMQWWNQLLDNSCRT